MSPAWLIATFAVGLFLGYLICDVINTENKITYHIKRLRAKEGGVISVEGEAVQSNQSKRNQRREARKNK